MRAAVGKSVLGEVRDTTRRVEALEAVTVFDVRQPRGLYLQSDGGDGGQITPILFDADGLILITSSDGSVALARNPWERKSVLDITVADGGGSCFVECESVSQGAEPSLLAPIGYLRVCLDNGDDTYTCVAVPYMTCNDEEECGP